MVIEDMFSWLLFYFLTGSTLGSFLNLCACRLPRGQSVVVGRSACDYCGKKLRIIELVPILSYLFLKGRCHYCGVNYGISHLFVEVLTGLAFVLCGMQTEFGLKLLLLFIFCCTVILISLIDYELQIIPDRLVLILAAGGGIYSALYLPEGLFQGLYGSLFAFAVMLAIFFISRGGMGGGDVKLSAAAGLWLGFENTVMFLLLSFIAGGIISILLLITGVKNKQDAVPFGPFLCAGAFSALLYAEFLANYYWNLFDF